MKNLLIATFAFAAMTLGGCHIHGHAGPVRHRGHGHHGHHYRHHRHHGHPVIDQMAQWENLGHVYLAADGSQSGSISTTSEKIFTSLQLVTQGSDLEMLGVVISFEDGDKFSPSINHFFTEGTRSLVVDLPTGNTRKVSGVEIRYSKLADGAWCNVELFGK